MRFIRSAARVVAETAALATTLVVYWLYVFPVARCELAEWTRRAERIGEPRMRALAVSTLTEGASLAEGAAIFATLVPRRNRKRLVRLLVAWQVAYDYLDTLGEQPDADELSHSACDVLRLALDPGVPLPDARADGGYLDALIASCRAEVERLDSFAVVQPVALRAAARCGQAQVHTNAVASGGPDALRRWATERRGGRDFMWWEIGAAGISSLAVHATLALAATPGSTIADARRVDRAYFPSICALSTLLDCVVDRQADAGTENHRTIDYYADPEQAIDRLEQIARHAARHARALPSGRRHLVILAGMTALYAVADRGNDHSTHARVARAVGSATAPIAWTLRLRRARPM